MSYRCTCIFCSLNVLSLKRNLAADMKHPSDTSTVSSRFSFSRAMHEQLPNLYRPLVVRSAITLCCKMSLRIFSTHCSSETSFLNLRVRVISTILWIGPSQVIIIGCTLLCNSFSLKLKYCCLAVVLLLLLFFSFINMYVHFLTLLDWVFIYSYHLSAWKSFNHSWKFRARLGRRCIFGSKVGYWRLKVILSFHTCISL